MRNAIAWSHDLLDEHQRAIFRRLAVFVGGFSLDAAGAVTGEDCMLFDTIADLVGSSLVMTSQPVGGVPRFTMLGIVREYGLELLSEHGEDVAVRNRHAAWFADMAEGSNWWLFLPTAEGERRLARLQAEAANIFAALEWLGQTGNEEALLRMASELGGLWVPSGYSIEGERWLEEALGRAPSADVRVRGWATVIRSWVLNMRGDPAAALALAEEALVMLKPRGDAIKVGTCLIFAAVAAHNAGEFELANRRLEEALAAAPGMSGIAWLPNWIVTITAHLGLVALLQGKIDRAEAWYRAALERQLAAGCAEGESHIYGHVVPNGLGDLARAKGNPTAAFQHYRRALDLGWRFHNVRAICYALGGMAGSLAVLGYHAEAARLFGASEAAHDAFGFSFNLETFDRQRALGLPAPWERPDASFGVHQALHDVIHPRLVLPSVRDPNAVEEQWTAGAELSMDEAVAEALALRPEPLQPCLYRPFKLSEREVEVLRHLVAGQSDGEIADALFITRRTVATHVRHIYDKMGISSRAQAAALAVRHGLA